MVDIISHILNSPRLLEEILGGLVLILYSARLFISPSRIELRAVVQVLYLFVLFLSNWLKKHRTGIETRPHVLDLKEAVENLKHKLSHETIGLG